MEITECIITRREKKRQTEEETRKDLDAGSLDLDLTANTDCTDRVENADETQYGARAGTRTSPGEHQRKMTTHHPKKWEEPQPQH